MAKFKKPIITNNKSLIKLNGRRIKSPDAKCYYDRYKLQIAHYSRPKGKHPVALYFKSSLGDGPDNQYALTMPLEDAYIYVKALKIGLAELPIYSMSSGYMPLVAIVYNKTNIITIEQLEQLYFNFKDFKKEIINESI